MPRILMGLNPKKSHRVVLDVLPARDVHGADPDSTGVRLAYSYPVDETPVVRVDMNAGEALYLWERLTELLQTGAVSTGRD